MRYIPAWVYVHNMSKLKYSFFCTLFFKAELLIKLYHYHCFFIIVLIFFVLKMKLAVGNFNGKGAPAVLWQTEES